MPFYSVHEEIVEEDIDHMLGMEVSFMLMIIISHYLGFVHLPMSLNVSDLLSAATRPFAQSTSSATPQNKTSDAIRQDVYSHASAIFGQLIFPSPLNDI